MTSAPLEETSAPERRVGLAPAVLVVMSAPERLMPLLSKLDVGDFTVHATDSFHDTRQQLRADPDVDVVITDITLPDANWCNILRAVRKVMPGDSPYPLRHLPQSARWLKGR